MKHIRLQVEMTRKQLAADHDQLRSIHLKLKRTHEVIDRAQAAYLEARELLARLENAVQDQPPPK